MTDRAWRIVGAVAVSASAFFVALAGYIACRWWLK